jgi:hypothetical protein
MKRFLILIISLVMLSVAGLSQQSDPLLPVDEKMTPEERAKFLNADYSNPAKIDTELPVEPHERGGDVRKGQWNLAQPDAQPIPLDERKEVVPTENIPATREVLQPSTSIQQPPGDKTGTIKNHRALNGQEDQPAGENPEVKSMNRRAINAPGTQPEGKGSKKKEK